jgi:hypothetical protein
MTEPSLSRAIVTAITPRKRQWTARAVRQCRARHWPELCGSSPVLAHVSIQCSDPKASRVFYHEVLGASGGA